ncbi:MAG: pyridoxamine 5'-phosphate oxidase family protein [Lentisphaerae bacterium]|jgi:uncharacterized protein|nr:pyridoxamine 5'-phosphate oxidase family protein [Lentisphaerota bacterium]MBT4818740.1 pyridoxamine 5'-phosphate oxidase family protein [Lentisphaerota bacterium]MBT5606433.1 pyridoxamine 5'-phosphate oxidase family protein [Lentisphaerota bacterium]MBT7057219.1 pyridoxamine 5'-phosphate oxidase family protein [Lentisphaerota bacterium]MBT7843536.1 pyridoxamine 5'-phosphate oxidase family protein [Lentisphaerota bacterium]
MRRSDKEITDRAAIDDIIRRCTICHMAMCDNGSPYVVPLNFGYDGKRIFIHCAGAGRKIDILKKNPRVCVEFALPGELVEGEEACSWGMGFESVIAFGQAQFVDQAADRRKALACMMAQYSEKTDWTFPESMVAQTSIIAIAIEAITGKRK